jgi:hypothetical protein
MELIPTTPEPGTPEAIDATVPRPNVTSDESKYDGFIDPERMGIDIERNNRGQTQNVGSKLIIITLLSVSVAVLGMLGAHEVKAARVHSEFERASNLLMSKMSHEFQQHKGDLYSPGVAEQFNAVVNALCRRRNEQLRYGSLEQMTFGYTLLGVFIVSLTASFMFSRRVLGSSGNTAGKSGLSDS